MSTISLNLDDLRKPVEFKDSFVDTLTRWIIHVDPTGNQYLFNAKGEPSTLYTNLARILESSLQRPIKILELGTWRGMSALAFAYGFQHKDSKVVTFDIVNCIPPEYNDESARACPQIEFKIARIQDYQHEDLKRQILSADLVFIDVDPHDGIQELELWAMLEAIQYKGFVLWDDIHLGPGHLGKPGPGMQYFWTQISKFRRCFDLTSIGHYSGTGLTIF